MRARFLGNGGNGRFDISNISTCVCPLLSLKIAENVLCWCLCAIGTSSGYTPSISCLSASLKNQVQIISTVFQVFGRFVIMSILLLYCSGSIVSSSSHFYTPHRFNGIEDIFSQMSFYIWIRSSNLGYPWVLGRVGI